MIHYILVPVSDSPRLVNLSEPSDLLSEWYKLLGCDIVEHVSTRYRYESIALHMLVDEEGLLRNKEVNEVASYLYGDTIVGDALICSVGPDDIEGLPSDICVPVLSFLNKLYMALSS